MKKNISIIVLFSLVLVFGVLIASCDNGVLPNYTYDANHHEIEQELRNPDLIPEDPPAATVYTDFYTITGPITTLTDNGDGIIEDTMPAADAAKLVALGTDKRKMLDPSSGAYYKVTFAVTTGVITITKGAQVMPDDSNPPDTFTP